MYKGPAYRAKQTESWMSLCTHSQRCQPGHDLWNAGNVLHCHLRQTQSRPVLSGVCYNSLVVFAACRAAFEVLAAQLRRRYAGSLCLKQGRKRLLHMRSGGLVSHEPLGCKDISMITVSGQPSCSSHNHQARTF